MLHRLLEYEIVTALLSTFVSIITHFSYCTLGQVMNMADISITFIFPDCFITCDFSQVLHCLLLLFQLGFSGGCGFTLLTLY